MTSSRLKTLAMGVSTALALSYAPTQAATITIKVGAAASFGNTANDLIGAFQAYYSLNYGLSYNIALTVDTPQYIEQDIINGGLSGPYDLFLSSDGQEPHDLYRNHTSLVIGSPIKYAQDFLELYSSSVDISNGLPYPLKTNFVIPDPTQDHYGEAAADVLASFPWFINPKTIPSGHVFTQPDVGTSFAAVNNGLYAYGFAAKSQICTNVGGTEYYPDGTYHHEYRPANPVHPSEKLVFKGIKIALTRTTDQETELTNFIAFLTGAPDVNGVATTAGTSLISRYCFKLP